MEGIKGIKESNSNYYGDEYFTGNVQVSRINHNNSRSLPPFTGSDSIALILFSVMMMISGVLYLVLEFIRKLCKLYDSGMMAAKGYLNSDELLKYKGAFKTISSLKDFLNLNMCVFSIVVIVTGLIGIIFTIFYYGEKHKYSTSVIKAVPFVCGFISLLASGAFTVLLMVMHTPILLFLMMLPVMYIAPILFTKKAWHFYKGRRI